MNGNRPNGAAPLELIKLDEAARRYPIGLRRLRHLVNSGEIGAIIFNPELTRRKRIRVRPEKVEEWLRAQERHHTPSPDATR